MLPTRRFHHGSRQARRNRRGFTLVEALAAGVVLAMTAVVIGGAVTRSIHALTISRDLQRASELLEATMTRIDLIGPARLMSEGPTEGRFDPPDDRFSWEAQIESLVETDLYEVTLTVRWPGAGGTRSAQLVTRLYDPPGMRDSQLQWEDLF